MVAVEKSQSVLLQSRNRTVAKSFYRELREQGFNHEQIIQLSTTLIDLVTDDLRPAAAEG